MTMASNNSDRLTAPPDERDELFESMRDALGQMVTMVKAEGLYLNLAKKRLIENADVIFAKAWRA